MTVIDYIHYVHSSKDSNWSTWVETLGGEHGSDAGKEFVRVGYEIALVCKLDTETGVAMAYGIKDGNEVVKFEREVRI